VRNKIAGHFLTSFLALVGMLLAFLLTYWVFFYVAFVLLDVVVGTRGAARYANLLVVIIFVLLFVLDRPRRAELDVLPIPRVGAMSSPISKRTGTAGARIIADVILSAPRSLKAAIRHFLLGVRLLQRRNKVGFILSILKDRERPIPAEELQSLCGYADRRDFLGDLRLIKGIIWLGSYEKLLLVEEERTALSGE
jgi:hypothetical protein